MNTTKLSPLAPVWTPHNSFTIEYAPMQFIPALPEFPHVNTPRSCPVEGDFRNGILATDMLIYSKALIQDSELAFQVRGDMIASVMATDRFGNPQPFTFQMTECDAVQFPHPSVSVEERIQAEWSQVIEEIQHICITHGKTKVTFLLIDSNICLDADITAENLEKRFTLGKKNLAFSDPDTMYFLVETIVQKMELQWKINTTISNSRIRYAGSRSRMEAYKSFVAQKALLPNVHVLNLGRAIHHEIMTQVELNNLNNSDYLDLHQIVRNKALRKPIDVRNQMNDEFLVEVMKKLMQVVKTQSGIALGKKALLVLTQDQGMKRALKGISSSTFNGLLTSERTATAIRRSAIHQSTTSKRF